MSFQQTTITGLTLDLSISGSMDGILDQVTPVFVDCEMDAGKVRKVLAYDGIEFARGQLKVSLPVDYDITELCDLGALAKRINDELEERDEARIDAFEWDRDYRMATI